MNGSNGISMRNIREFERLLSSKRVRGWWRDGHSADDDKRADPDLLASYTARFTTK